MRRGRTTLLLLAAALLLLTLAGLFLGASAVPPVEMLRDVFSGNVRSAGARIFLYVRLPRVLAAILAGASLSAAGLILQSVLRNPLAAPGVIGVNAGAGLAALAAMVLFPALPQLTPLAAFVGACAAAFGVYLLARLAGASRTTIVLAGVAVNSILGAVSDGIVTLIPEALVGRSAFSIGGFSGVTMRQLGFAAPFCACALLLALLMRRELSVLALGDDVAHSLGLGVERVRTLLLLSAAMLAGAAVSFAGLLGFVGLIAPHMTRMLLPEKERLHLPAAAMAGAALCLLCDLIARTVFAPGELPVGVVLSCVGAPFFLFLLLRRRGRGGWRRT